jgi:hypothetical protein
LKFFVVYVKSFHEEISDIGAIAMLKVNSLCVLAAAFYRGLTIVFEKKVFFAFLLFCC